jgi:hypothetical protein
LIAGEIGDTSPECIEVALEITGGRAGDAVDLVLGRVGVVGEIEENAPVEERKLQAIIAALALRIREQFAIDVAAGVVGLKIVRGVVGETKFVFGFGFNCLLRFSSFLFKF